MGKLNYFISHITKMNYKAMFAAVKKIHNKSGNSVLKILIDMAKCGIKYGAGYKDYMLFQMYNVPEFLRETYITRRINEQYVHLLNNKLRCDDIDNKLIFNRLYSKFIKRQWIDLSETKLEQFIDFFKDKENIVVKIPKGTGGLGVKVINLQDITNLESFYIKLKTSGYILVEEFIKQHKDMSKLYFKSVNTIRLVTILDKKQFPNIVFSSLRMGNGNNVDNFHSGGIITLINLDDGKISKPAANIFGEPCKIHPISSIELLNYQIPMFKKAVDMVKEAALVIPSLRYVAWDVAIGEKEPILIEGNYAPGYIVFQFPFQIENKIGLKPKFDEIINN